MKRVWLALFAAVAGGALLASTPGAAVAGAPPRASIVSVSVTCPDGTFDVAVQFTHHGSTEVRAYEFDSPDATVGMDSDHLWFKGVGTDSVVLHLVGTDAGTGDRYFQVHLLQANHRDKQLVDLVTPWSGGPYSCP